MHKFPFIFIAVSTQKQFTGRDEAVEHSIYGLVTLHVVRCEPNDCIHNRVD
jgi:hypothetical protein